MKMRNLSILITIVFSINTHAASWTLQNVSFSDGESAGGTFDFDPTTETYSNINISVSDDGAIRTYTSDGTFLSPECVTDPFGPNCVQLTGDESLLVSNSIPVPSIGALVNAQLFLAFLEPLTSGSTTIQLSTESGASTEFIAGCLNSGACIPLAPGWYSEARNISSGYVTTSAVPLPAAAWLFLSALGGLGLIKRKRG